MKKSSCKIRTSKKFSNCPPILKGIYRSLAKFCKTARQRRLGQEDTYTLKAKGASNGTQGSFPRVGRETPFWREKFA
jgi:hypothetical protein